MDKLTGMEVAREIRKTDNNVKIVFSTSGNEFASESYEVNARYYLHKPFGIERVKAMLDRIDIAGLEKMRAERLPDDSLIRFCENTAANAVLLYFAQQAKSNGIDYIVKADIPSDIFIASIPKRIFPLYSAICLKMRLTPAKKKKAIIKNCR